jgi:thiol-disulfide isomerase/thioredoxin
MQQLKLVLYFIIMSFSWSTVFADILLTTSDGTSIGFSSLRGRWVLINYWANWCHPCLAEINQLNRFYESHKDSVALFAVNIDMPSPKKLQRLIMKLGIHYQSLANDPSGLLQLGAISGVPLTFIFDPQGQLHETLYGPQTVKTLTQAIGLPLIDK